MITYLKNTDVIKAFKEHSGEKILIHVVNCQGVMGSGIALQIKNEFPDAYKAYKFAHQKQRLILGTYTWERGTDFEIINLAAQKYYGTDKRHLNYGALAKCLSGVAYEFITPDSTLFVPYKMGCDRAGGDWEIVEEMLEFFFRDVDVVVCQL